ncbi:LssY C-terminal domain-containing protein [Edaphobacter bradus]|uniref:LssY C-terminal domain-containing protein n=1 Tax=Edaphobacter bradus TaxID=2259016 RepID=UPI0021E07EE8|nr:LssY C-terminal domain-containing protein [Edaphobacter bradus]
MRKAAVLLLIPGVLAGLRAQTAPAADTAAAAAVSTVPAGAGVQAIVSMRDHPATGATAKIPTHKQSYEFTLNNTDWLDTGVVLSAGEQATFTVTGSFLLADGRTAGPDGLDRGWKDLLRSFPLNDAKVGSVIGRVSDVGATVPFAIGAGGEITMPTSGKLFLRVNTTSDLNPTGSFTVKMKFAKAARTQATAASATPAEVVTKLVSPETFAEIPRRVNDRPSGEGNPGDMVNFALIGTPEQVEAAYRAAGWASVDKDVQSAILNGLMKTLSHESYTEMPMSTLYLFGRPQDYSFARADPIKVAAERHHLRVWKTDQTIDGRPLWVGSATHDIGFEKDQRNGRVTHKIDPEIDTERDYLLQSFDAAGAFSSAAYVTPTNPMTEAKTATGGSFHSDGRIVVMDLSANLK